MSETINFDMINFSDDSMSSDYEYADGVEECKNDERMVDHEVGDVDDSSSSENEEGVFEVESILDMRYVAFGRQIYLQYLIQYSGYEDEPEWTFAVDCKCDDAIDDFLAVRNRNTAWLLCRTSVKNDNENSLKTQEALMRTKLKEIHPNFNIQLITIDGKSAFTGVPREYGIIRKYAKHGDIVLVSRVDRFGRKIKEFSEILNELKDRNVDVYSVSEDCSYIKNNVHFVRLLADAQLESENQGARRKLGKERKMAIGQTYFGGPVPFGKKKVVINGVAKLEDDEMEKNTILFITSSNRTNKHMASYLNEMNNLRRGKLWTSISVASVRMKNTERMVIG